MSRLIATDGSFLFLGLAEAPDREREAGDAANVAQDRQNDHVSHLLRVKNFFFPARDRHTHLHPLSRDVRRRLSVTLSDTVDLQRGQLYHMRRIMSN